jgi:hypothetical protein
MEVLEARRKVELVKTSRTILRLFDFFDRITIQDFKGASSIIDELGLLPNSIAEIQAKVTNFSSLDPLLQEAFPPLLLEAMVALYQQHEKEKHGGMVADRDTVQQRLRELREKAKALMAFSGRLNLHNGSDTLQRMTKMEASMV